MKTKLKICGITSVDEFHLLNELGVDYAGLWFDIPGGRFSLDISTLRKLSINVSHCLEHMLVTTSNNFRSLLQALDETGLGAIQFHGFQTPSFIRKFKQDITDPIKVFKVLHVSRDICLEERFINYYIDYGTDYFILDSYSEDGRIGSTGIELSIDFLDRFLSKWNIADRTLLAGGINPGNIPMLVERYQPFGFDIDSAARNQRGLNREKVANITASLRAVDTITDRDDRDCISQLRSCR